MKRSRVSNWERALQEIQVTHQVGILHTHRVQEPHQCSSLPLPSSGALCSLLVWGCLDLREKSIPGDHGAHGRTGVISHGADLGPFA